MSTQECLIHPVALTARMERPKEEESGQTITCRLPGSFSPVLGRQLEKVLPSVPKERDYSGSILVMYHFFRSMETFW